MPVSLLGPAGSLQRIESVRAARAYLVVRANVDSPSAATARPQDTAVPTMSTAWIASQRLPFGATPLGKVVADPRLRMLVLEALGAVVVVGAVLVVLSRARHRRSTPAEPDKAPFSEEWWRLLARS
ncbi:MAG TPA: hypothetical protein VMU09_07700 [Acidimicrobiales bacterium]|nr:hypothetical protein [Acidimicrobiales bacterium]